jgi:type II secretory pathway pseudopilin PulG
MSAKDPRNASRSRGAFTLIELVGVLAVLAILASVMTPVAVKRLDVAARDGESSSLAAMAEAFVQASLTNRAIPTTNNFPQLIASYLNEPTNTVRINKRGLGRVFMADPNLSINGGGLPYSQTAAGTTNLPSGVRFMIVSSVAKALPTLTNFNDIWITSKGSLPSSLSSWGGRGEDLIVERIELGPLFHKIVLMNGEFAPAVAKYSIDNSVTNSIEGLTRFSGYFMEGTVLNMFRPDGVVDFREVIQNDFSFAYKNGRWGSDLGSSGDDDGGFGQLVNRFLQQPVPCDPASGATQRAVVNAFYEYLWGYADWAFGDTSAVPPIPPFAGSGSPSTPNYPSYTVVYNATTRVSGSAASFTGNLIK